MKKILKFIGLGVTVMLYASSSFAQGADTVAITLKDAWDIALSKSLTVMVADKEIEKTGYEKKGAYASLFPNVAFSGTYQRTIKKQTMVMKMGDVTQKISMGTDNNISGGFNADKRIRQDSRKTFTDCRPDPIRPGVFETASLCSHFDQPQLTDVP